MRYVLHIIFLFIFCCNFLIAQKNKDTLQKVNLLKKKLESEFDIKNYKSDPHDRLIFELNHTGFLNLPPTIKQDNLKSIGFNFAFMFDKPLGNSNFSFAYGLGLLSHNFHSNADFIYVKDSIKTGLLTTLKPFERPYTLNRFAQKILEVPLEFRFRTKTDKQFKIHLGGKIGYVVNDFRSIKDNDGKVRLYHIKNVNKLRYGVNFRIGYEQFCLTATYYLSEVFTSNGPTGITPYTIGLAIIPY
ncbi:MAG: PorT family protein [Bacteroidetes bacterium]|nr:PorT family protein [Bacteroidota bacterium]